MSIQKPVPGYKQYTASADGFIFGPWGRGIVPLRNRPGPTGYLRVTVCRGSSDHKDMYVHRLVAMAFHGIPSTEGDWTVHHKNSVRTDNRPENLEWCHRSENTSRSAKAMWKKRKTP